MAAGGWEILKYSFAPIQIVISHGMSGVGGYLTGGGLVLCGLIPMIRPSQRYTFGILGMVLAVVSLIVSNLGGFLVGMLLGVVGGAMTVGWGPKPARRPSRRARRAAEGA
jgi:hypothetical protein